MTTPEPEGRHTDADTGERWYEYPPTGELLDSVTTIIDGTQSKPWLRTWHATSALGWAADNLDEFTAALGSGATFAEGRKAAVSLGKGAADEIREVRRDAGTFIHDVVERLILWATSPDWAGAAIALPVLPDHLAEAWYGDEPLCDVVDFMVDGFVNWVYDFSPRFLASEMTVYNQPLGVAGTLDIIAEIAGYALNDARDAVIAAPGGALCPCVDVKSGKNPDGGWREQLAAYRRMTECRPSRLDDLRPMPATDCGMVLHLRPEYPHGYLLMLVSAGDDEEAWETFQAATLTYRRRQKCKGKPGKSVRALRPDGTMPGPRLCDLAGEGWGRALAPLARALGADAELEDVARFTEAELLAVKGVGPKLAGDIREILAGHGLNLVSSAHD